MTSSNRKYSLLDQCLIQLDQGVRTVFGRPVGQHSNPSMHEASPTLTSQERRHSAGLMRVNHAGEISAQALYQAQALTSKNTHVCETMRHAAEEENDHLSWCKDRLDELDSHVSYLAPFWYTGSFAIGTIAGLAGDKWSLGFLAETENQVVQHLTSHLEKLPAQDIKSRKIVEQMRQDEARHANTALKIGANELPTPVKKIMSLFSKVMTKTAYWL